MILAIRGIGSTAVQVQCSIRRHFVNSFEKIKWALHHAVPSYLFALWGENAQACNDYLTSKRRARMEGWLGAGVIQSIQLSQGWDYTLLCDDKG